MAGEAPYNLEAGGNGFKLKAWWLSVRSSANEVLVDLAVLLIDVVPHAAAPERTFSTMGWFQTDTRNRLGAHTTGMLTAIKTHYENKVPRCVQHVLLSGGDWGLGIIHVLLVHECAAADMLHECLATAGDVTTIITHVLHAAAEYHHCSWMQCVNEEEEGQRG